ncbi:MAG TPA: hypothetical protein PLA94_25895, partial [Myxococcota bacterium]|nr:hypothetical protein [Myxococcota bacterium]
MRRFLLLLPLVGCATVPQTGHRLKPAVSPELQRDLDRVVENMPKDNEGAGVKSGITRINVGDYPELEAQLVEVEVMVMEKLSVDLEHPAYALDLIQVGSRLGYRAMDADTGMVIEEGELVNNELVAGELPVPAFCTESSRGALNCEGRLTFRRSGDDGLSARLDYLVPQMLQTGPTCRAALGRDNASPLDSPAALGPEEERAVGQETTSTNLPGAGNANTANGTPLPRLPSILKQIIIPLTGDGRNVLVASTFGDSVVVYSRAGGEPVHLVGDSVQVAEWMYYPEAVGAMVEHLRKLEGALETRPHETVGLEVKFSAMLRGNASKLPAQIHASVGQTTVAKQYSAGRSSSVVGIQGPTTATMTARRGIFNVQYSAPTYNNTAMADLFFDSGADTVANQTMVDLPGDEDNLLVE